MFHIQHAAKQKFLPGFLGALVEAAPHALNDYAQKQIAASNERTRQKEALLKLGIEQQKAEAATKKSDVMEQNQPLANELKKEQIKAYQRKGAQADSLQSLFSPRGQEQEVQRGPVEDEGVGLEQDDTALRDYNLLRPDQKKSFLRKYEDLSRDEKTRLGIEHPSVARVLQAERDAETDEKRYQTKESAAHEDRIDKSYDRHEKFINATDQAAHSAEGQEATFTRMRQLIDSGELSPSWLANVFSFLGVPEGLLMNPANEEYVKQALEQTKNIISEYGNRPLLQEFNVLLKRIPTLQNTDEGKRQIIEDMRIMSELPVIKQKHLQAIIDESESKNQPLPRNLQGVLTKRMQPDLDKVYHKFKERQGRVPVKTGTPPDKESVLKYAKLTKDPKTGKFDEARARKWMEEDGYDVQ